MTIRVSMSQAQAYRALSDEWKTPGQLGYTEATLDALARAGYADKEESVPPRYKRGQREL